MSTEPSVDTSDANAGESGRQAGEFSGGRLAAGPLMGLLFALVGGGLAWAVVQACYPLFPVPNEYDFPNGPPPHMVEEVKAHLLLLDRHNRIFAGTLLGALLGGALGVGEGIARRSLKTILLGAVGCTVVAALVGCAAGLGSHLTYVGRAAMEDRLSVASTVMVQCALWAPLGAGVGLTLGSLSGRLRTAIGCLFAGLAAGALAAAIYPIASSLLLPGSLTDLPVPLGGDTRLLWIGCPAVLLGLIVPFAGRQDAKGRPK